MPYTINKTFTLIFLLSADVNATNLYFYELVTDFHDGIISLPRPAVSGLYCEADFSNCIFIPKREDKFE